jgi:hypothetical protein
MEDEPPRTFPRIASMRPIVEIWLGIGMKAPVVQEILVHLAHAERNRDERIDVAAASFEQQHCCLLVFAETMGKHTARRARANDRIVEASFRHCCHSPDRGGPGCAART